MFNVYIIHILYIYDHICLWNVCMCIDVYIYTYICDYCIYNYIHIYILYNRMCAYTYAYHMYIIYICVCVYNIHIQSYTCITYRAQSFLNSQCLWWLCLMKRVIGNNTSSPVDCGNCLAVKLFLALHVGSWRFRSAPGLHWVNGPNQPLWTSK